MNTYRDLIIWRKLAVIIIVQVLFFNGIILPVSGADSLRRKQARKLPAYVHYFEMESSALLGWYNSIAEMSELEIKLKEKFSINKMKFPAESGNPYLSETEEKYYIEIKFWGKKPLASLSIYPYGRGYLIVENRRKGYEWTFSVRRFLDKIIPDYLSLPQQKHRMLKPRLFKYPQVLLFMLYYKRHRKAGIPSLIAVDNALSDIGVSDIKLMAIRHLSVAVLGTNFIFPLIDFYNCWQELEGKGFDIREEFEKTGGKIDILTSKIKKVISLDLKEKIDEKFVHRMLFGLGIIKREDWSNNNFGWEKGKLSRLIEAGKKGDISGMVEHYQHLVPKYAFMVKELAEFILWEFNGIEIDLPALHRLFKVFRAQNGSSFKKLDYEERKELKAAIGQEVPSIKGENIYFSEELWPLARLSAELDKTPAPGQALDDREIWLKKYLDKLTEKERKVLWMYYAEGYNKREIGDEFGHTREWARLEIGKALKKLRRYLKVKIIKKSPEILSSI